MILTNAENVLYDRKGEIEMTEKRTHPLSLIQLTPTKIV